MSKWKNGSDIYHMVGRGQLSCLQGGLDHQRHDNLSTIIIICDYRTLLKFIYFVPSSGALYLSSGLVRWVEVLARVYIYSLFT